VKVWANPENADPDNWLACRFQFQLSQAVRNVRGKYGGWIKGENAKDIWQHGRLTLVEYDRAGQLDSWEADVDGDPYQLDRYVLRALGCDLMGEVPELDPGIVALGLEAVVAVACGDRVERNDKVRSVFPGAQRPGAVSAGRAVLVGVVLRVERLIQGIQGIQPGLALLLGHRVRTGDDRLPVMRPVLHRITGPGFVPPGVRRGRFLGHAPHLFGSLNLTLTFRNL